MDKNLHMNKKTSLYEFGYNFLGPICSQYFTALDKYTDIENPTIIGFLAREGYLFKEIYQTLVNEGLVKQRKSTYIYASRTFLFRICIGDRITWSWSLGHGFEGSFQKLLTARFGFTLEQVQSVFSEDELAQDFILPDQIKDVEKVLDIHLAQLKQLVNETRTTYLDYLQSLGLTSESEPLFLDVGYSGTIQKLLTHLLSINTSGLYFITTASGDYSVNGRIATMECVFKNGVKMGDGYTMLDRSLFLECLLTSPNGQFIDIHKNTIDGSFNFMFGRQAYAQNQIHELNVVFDGAIDAVVTAFKSQFSYTSNEIEALYEQFARKRNMIPRAAWPLFDVDDAISGNGNVDPLSFFGL
jgi:hypothetical protein